MLLEELRCGVAPGKPRAIPKASPDVKRAAGANPCGPWTFGESRMGSNVKEVLLPGGLALLLADAGARRADRAAKRQNIHDHSRHTGNLRSKDILEINVDRMGRQPPLQKPYRLTQPVC